MMSSSRAGTGLRVGGMLSLANAENIRNTQRVRHRRAHAARVRAEIILASARRSPGFYFNTWAKDVPGWRGCQVRLGLDDTSPAASVSCCCFGCRAHRCWCCALLLLTCWLLVMLGEICRRGCILGPSFGRRQGRSWSDNMVDNKVALVLGFPASVVIIVPAAICWGRPEQGERQ